MKDDSIVKNFDLVIGMFVKPNFPEEIPRMTVDEHKEFVKGLVDGSIFSSMHIHEEDKLRGAMGKVFVPQATGIFSAACPESFRNDIGVIWEFVKESRGMYKGTKSGIAYPVFHTCRVCSKLDWDLACDALKALRAAIDIKLVETYS